MAPIDPGETKNGEGREFPLTVDLKALLMEQRQRATALERDLDRIVPWVFFLPDGDASATFERRGRPHARWLRFRPAPA